MSARVLALVAALGLFAAACNNDCYNLANNVCMCSATQQQQQACQAAISLANGTAVIDQATLSHCTAMLQTCDCRMLATNTYAAKGACGLARGDPNDRALNPGR